MFEDQMNSSTAMFAAHFGSLKSIISEMGFLATGTGTGTGTQDGKMWNPGGTERQSEAD
jgi:hypothetical protein